MKLPTSQDINILLPCNAMKPLQFPSPIKHRFCQKG